MEKLHIACLKHKNNWIKFISIGLTSTILVSPFLRTRPSVAEISQGSMKCLWRRVLPFAFCPQLVSDWSRAQNVNQADLRGAGSDSPLVFTSRVGGAVMSLFERLVWLENPKPINYVKLWANGSYFIVTFNETVFYTIKRYCSLNFEAALYAFLQCSASSERIVFDSPGSWLPGFYCFLLNSCCLL